MKQASPGFVRSQEFVRWVLEAMFGSQVSVPEPKPPLMPEPEEGRMVRREPEEDWSQIHG